MTKATTSLLVWLLLPAAVACAAVASDNATQTGHPAGPSSPPLTLNAVLDQVLSRHPDAAAARAEVVASAADERQAGAIANPTLSLAVENFAGNETLQGFGGAETTLSIEQSFELGGQRGKRRALAAATQQTALRRQELTRAELYLRTVEAFLSVLAAQERQQLAEARLLAATRTLESVAAQVEAGKAPAIAAVRSRPQLVEARLEQQRALAALRTARTALAALLAADAPAALVVSGALLPLPEPPTAADPVATPQLALAVAERERAERELSAARAQALPDLTLGLGLRRFEESGETALVAGLSLPLPLFDRNGGGIAAATARWEEARLREQGTRLRLAAELDQAVEAFRTAHAAAQALQEELLPAAREACEAIDFGYRAGRFGLFELLDAHRQVSEVQERLLTAQVECHLAAARLDALLGRFPLASAGANP